MKTYRIMQADLHNKYSFLEFYDSNLFSINTVIEYAKSIYNSDNRYDILVVSEDGILWEAKGVKEYD